MVFTATRHPGFSSTREKDGEDCHRSFVSEGSMKRKDSSFTTGHFLSVSSIPYPAAPQNDRLSNS